MTRVRKLLEYLQKLEQELENINCADYNELMEDENNSNIVDLTDYFEKTPSMQEVKDFLNKMVQEGKKFVTQSPDWIVDIPSGSKKKDHIAKSSRFVSMSNMEKRRHNKYVLALEDLLAQAEYVRGKENSKKDIKPNVNKYHYFKVWAKINDKIYEIIFDTEEYINDNITKPQTVHLYNITEV